MGLAFLNFLRPHFYTRGFLWWRFQCQNWCRWPSLCSIMVTFFEGEDFRPCRTRRRDIGMASSAWLPLSELWTLPSPICSMYGIFTYFYPTNGPNVGKYTIHGAYGSCNVRLESFVHCSWKDVFDSCGDVCENAARATKALGRKVFRQRCNQAQLVDSPIAAVMIWVCLKIG